MTTSTPLQLIARIPAASFLAVEAALPLLRRQQPDLSAARFDVVGVAGVAAIVIATTGSVSVGVQLAQWRMLDADELRRAAAGAEQGQRLGSFEARHHGVIAIAVDMFRKQRPDIELDAYAIELVGEGAGLVVLFSDLQRPHGTRGSVGRPGFEVEMDAETGKVRRANFVR